MIFEELEKNTSMNKSAPKGVYKVVPKGVYKSSPNGVTKPAPKGVYKSTPKRESLNDVRKTASVRKSSLEKDRYARKDDTKKTLNKMSQRKHHSHPAAEGAVVEKKQAYVGSLGAVNTEGCVEHGNVRYVKKRKVKLKKHYDDTLKEYFIMSEVLGKPRCKK